MDTWKARRQHTCSVCVNLDRPASGGPRTVARGPAASAAGTEGTPLASGREALAAEPRWPLREARRGPCGSGDHPRPASLCGGTRPRTWQAQDGPTAFATSGQTCRAAAPPPLLGLLVEPAKDSGSTEGPVRAAEGRGSGRERGPRSGPEGTARSEQLHGSRGAGEAVPCPPHPPPRARTAGGDGPASVCPGKAPTDLQESGPRPEKQCFPQSG